MRCYATAQTFFEQVIEKTPRLWLQKLQFVINPSVPKYHNYGLEAREVNNAVSRKISLREWTHVLCCQMPFHIILLA